MANKTPLILGDNLYRWGKKLVQVIIPACASLYYGLGKIWDFPKIEQVLGTSVVVATFIGTVLGISSLQYDASGAGYQGQLVVEPREDGGKVATLELKDDPSDIHTKKAVNLQVIDKTGGAP